MTKSFSFGAILPELISFEKLNQLADHDPVRLLESCRNRKRAIDHGIRSLNWELWVACYAGARGIQKHPERFKDLLKHDYFKKRTYQANINDVLRLSLLIGIEADTSGLTYKKACNIAARLQPFFDDKVDAEDLFNSIEEAGGLKKLSRSNNICEKYQVCDDDDDGFSTTQDGISTSLFPQPRSPSGLVTLPGNPLPPNHRTKRIPHGRPNYQANFEVDEFNGLATEDDKIILEVVVDQHMLREILNSPYGSRTRIIIEHHKSDPGWENIEAISANVID